MNQLFDGHGDKMSLAQLWQRYVPINSTSMCLGVQPQPFLRLWWQLGKQCGCIVDLLSDSYLQQWDLSGISFHSSHNIDNK